MRPALLPLLAVLAALAPSLAAQDAPEAAPAAEFDAVLVARVLAVLTPPASGPRPEPEAMAAALAALGEPVLPVVVAALAGELDLPVEVPDGSGEAVHPAALAARADVLRASLRDFEPAAVVAHLAERAGGEAPMDVKLFAVGLLGETDDARAARAVLDIVASIEPIHLLRGYVQGSLEGALANQLAYRPRTLIEVERVARTAGPELTCVLARAVGRVRSAKNVELLVHLLGRHASADPVLLEQIGRLAGDGGLAVDPTLLGELRVLLGHPEPAVQRAAAAALGRLRDEQSLPALAALLSSGDPRVAAAARWSLRLLAGQDLGAQPQAWIGWQERERSWWDEAAPAVLEALSSDQPGEVFQAITVLVQHPLVRHEASEALGPLLLQADPDLALVACGALAQLGSTRALDWLVTALASDDRPLRMEARAALVRMTGLELPADSVAWARVVKG